MGGGGGEEWVGGEGDTGWSLPSSLFSTISWCRNVLDIQEHSPLEEGQFGFILEVAGNHGVFWKWRERAEYITILHCRIVVVAKLNNFRLPSFAYT